MTFDDTEREWLEGLRYEDKFPDACKECGGLETHTGMCSQSEMRNPDHPFNASGDMRDLRRDT